MVVVPRAPTPTIEQQEVFRPTAAPVDTYIRAPDPAPSDLHNLAKGLENFSRDIRGMFQAREARDEEANRIRGEAQFFQDNQVGYAEAVRTGKVPAFASRPFMAAYKEAEGKVIGARLASQMQLEYQTWSGRNSQDPANFDQFMGEFLKRNLTQDDPDVLKGAMPYIYQTVNAGYTQRTQDAADAVYNGGLNAGIAVNSMVIDDFSDSVGTDYDALWEELIANRGSQLSVGTRAADYDTKLIDMIAAKAIEARDPALLALLDKPLPGEASPISATPYGREVKARTIDAMQTINSQADTAAYTAQTRRDKALHDELTAFAVEAIFANPDAVLPDNFWAAYSKVEPEARVKIQELRNAALRGVQEDPELVSDLTYRILVEGEDPLTVLRTHGDSLDGGTVQKLYEMSQETPVWQDSQAYRLGLKTIQAKANEGNSMSLNPEYVSPAASAASMDFELSMRAWAKTEQGKEAIANNDVAAMATQIGRVQAVIMGGFTTSESAQATYAVPDAIATIRDVAGMPANPLADTQSAIDAADAAAAEYAASPAAQLKDWTNTTPPELTSLPPEVQQVIRQQADDEGVDPQIILEEAHREVNARLKALESGAAIDQGLEDVFDNAPTVQPQSLSPAEDTNFLIERLVTKGRDSDITEMNAPLVTGLSAMIRSAPPEIAEGLGILSGTRSIERQEVLWQDALVKYGSEAEARKWVAPPGNSQHNHGNAADLSYNGKSLRHAPPEVIAWVHDNAAQFGLHFPLANENWHVEPLGTRGTQPHQHTPQAATSPAAPLLEFISQEEGTAGSDPYNTVYGGDIKPLTTMTLAEVRQLDTPAAGKYQIQSATLGDAMQALALSPDEKFTPEVQDQVAMWLLERRGLGQWLDGRLTDDAFVDNLADEWAALAGADGLPKYEGQGAGASLPRLLATLTTLKQ